MDYARPPMTRWSAQLRDRDQERRFRRYNLPLQRRTAIVAVLVIVLGDLAVFASTAVLRHSAVSPLRWAIQGCVAAAGVLLVVELVRHHRPRTLFRIVAAGGLFLSIAIAAMIATGPGMGFRGSILVVAGVVVIYLAAPLTLVGSTVLGVLYSAITIPTWLVTTDAWTSTDVPYVLAAVLLGHLIMFAEARRSQHERRVLYAQREALREMTTADPLTGVRNRRSFDQQLDRQWQAWAAGEGPLSLLMIDIDHFKDLNDSVGHAAGDHALRAVAETIRRALPDAGCEVARYGGEEFACLLPGWDHAGAVTIAATVLRAVRAESIQAPGPRGVLTISIGVATATPDTAAAGELVDAADQRLYRAKQAGRDCVDAGPRDAEPSRRSIDT